MKPRTKFIDKLFVHLKGGAGGNGLPKLNGIGGKGGNIWITAKESKCWLSIHGKYTYLISRGILPRYFNPNNCRNVGMCQEDTLGNFKFVIDCMCYLKMHMIEDKYCSHLCSVEPNAFCFKVWVSGLCTCDGASCGNDPCPCVMRDDPLACISAANLEPTQWSYHKTTCRTCNICGLKLWTKLNWLWSGLEKPGDGDQSAQTA